MINLKLLKNYIQSNGNASLASRMSNIPVRTGQRYLSNFDMDDAYNILYNNSFRSVILPIGDIHMGEVVKPHKLNIENEYDQEIALIRIDKLFENVKKFLDEKTEIVDIVYLGDAISGGIHDELRESDQGTALENVNIFTKSLIDNIKSLFEYDLIINIYGVTSNHNRLTKQTYTKNQAENSFDYQIMENLKYYFEDYEWVTIHPIDDDLLIRSGGVDWAVTHGHMGSGSPAPGAFKGQAVQRAFSLERQFLQNKINVDYVLMGHFHTSAKIENYFFNGSMVGCSEYGQKKLRLNSYTPKHWMFKCENEKLIDFKEVDLSEEP